MSSKEPRILLVEPNEVIRNDILKVLSEKNFGVICSLRPDDVLFSDEDVEAPIGLILISDDFDRSLLSESSLVLGSARKLPQQIPVVVMTEIDTRKSPLELVINNWFHTLKKP